MLFVASHCSASCSFGVFLYTRRGLLFFIASAMFVAENGYPPVIYGCDHCLTVFNT